VFPEYEQLFTDTFGKSSTEVLINYILFEEFLEVDTSKLANRLQEASNGRFGDYRALQKAKQIKESA